MVRAKFKVDSITGTMGWRRDPNGDFIPAVLNTVTMSRVASGSKDNVDFFNATPTPFGKLEMGAVCDGLFDLEKEYYIDFTPAN